MAEFLIKLLISAVLSMPIWAAFDVFGHPIPWLIAELISLVLVFGGWFILVDTDGAWD